MVKGEGLRSDVTGIVPEVSAMPDFHSFFSMSYLNHHTLMLDFNLNLSNQWHFFHFNA